MRPGSRPSRRCALVALWLVAFPAAAQSTGPADAGATQTVEPLRALLNDTLEPGVSPGSLFEVPLTDEAALQLERVRTAALLAALPPHAPDAGLDEASWQARLELDRLRLAFYELTPEARAALLEAHVRRLEAAAPKETDEARRAREAEVERARALEAARLARSEAERLVSEELARLIGVESEVAALRDRFRGEREALMGRRASVLVWQRKVREARAGPPGEADTTYDALRRSLRTTRDELEQALGTLTAVRSEVPPAGPDALAGLPLDYPADGARERRAAVDREVANAIAEESALREDRASGLLEEANALNRERLGLLEFLTADKRSAVTGFSDAGLDQARAEIRHLLLIVRYHRNVVAGWFGAVGKGPDISAWAITRVAAAWVLAALAFLWWRKRSPEFLKGALKRTIEDERAARRTQPGTPRRVVLFLAGINHSLAWLLFFLATVAFLPGGLLEVQLLSVIVGWSLGAALVVDAINALTAATDDLSARRSDELAALRLRSLKLVGRVVVSIILVLVLSSRLVGQGTVYNWVLSTAWLAGLPVFLVLIRWWRAEVFQRVDQLRRKSRFQDWVLANRQGWKSFLAATLAGVQLFTLGAYKIARNRLNAFHLTRRVLAWLFKRDLERQAEEGPRTELTALGENARALLAPERAAPRWLDSAVDEHLEMLRVRVAAGRGGLIALVGRRGSGKSSLLRQLKTGAPAAVDLACGPATVAADLQAMVTATPSPPGLVLLDDAQRLIKPILGGLEPFDEALTWARSHSAKTVWVFAIDATLWPFLRRARDNRLLFDEVLTIEGWTDEQIGRLLTSRSEEAGLAPNFIDLLEELPRNADEVDKQEALEAKRTGYFRMVWDYALGNPAIALEVWRNSLGLGPDGTARVRTLAAPGTQRLDTLPDSSIFVLRAVLQLAPARVADVVEATRLTETAVLNAFRYGQAHGYLVETSEGVEVAWPWLRAVTLFLERRHLLVNQW